MDEYISVFLLKILRCIWYSCLNISRRFMPVEVQPEKYNQLDIDEIDKLDVFLAPKIIGSKYSLSSFSGKGVSCIDEAREFVSMDVSKVGKDLHISAKVKDYATDVINSTSNLGEKLKCLQV